MAKNIIFCADGTWNSPDQDENHDELPDPTNVYKLFLHLAGDMDCLSLLKSNEQEKELVNAQGQVLQIAKYLHGVGDSNNAIHKLLGGVFGAGVISRIVRGYTFISRHYQPGDQIFIIGFSRGAYTARALAGLIAKRGLLRYGATLSPERAYAKGALVWKKHHAQRPSSLLARLADLVNSLNSELSDETLALDDLRPVDRIAAVGVWDTVGAMGLPTYARDGERADTFKFADLKLSTKVVRGFHAVSLDEQRPDFAPTLWEPGDNVVQMLFPGAHSDVGGGYPVANNESGLSDISLAWMLEQLQSCGLVLQSQLGVPISPRAVWPMNPDPMGIGHQPWRQPPWDFLLDKPQLRQFPAHVQAHPSIAQRCQAACVKAAPDAEPERYVPQNLP